jgi:hypothetical protein
MVCKIPYFSTYFSSHDVLPPFKYLEFKYKSKKKTVVKYPPQVQESQVVCPPCQVKVKRFCKGKHQVRSLFLDYYSIERNTMFCVRVRRILIVAEIVEIYWNVEIILVIVCAIKSHKCENLKHWIMETKE